MSTSSTTSPYIATLSTRSITSTPSSSGQTYTFKPCSLTYTPLPTGPSSSGSVLRDKYDQAVRQTLSPSMSWDSRSGAITFSAEGAEGKPNRVCFAPTSVGGKAILGIRAKFGEGDLEGVGSTDQGRAEGQDGGRELEVKVWFDTVLDHNDSS